MTEITIVGAGMAGLLAAAILRSDAGRIIEGQKSLPNNHSAVLRFRTSAVGDALNIPFRRVQVMKAVASIGNPVADALSYSMKTTGVASLRSSISARGDIDERFIAPSDLIQRMAERVTCPISFGRTFKFSDADQNLPIISTIPMPVLMGLLNWPGETPEFKWSEGVNVNADLMGVDAYATLYVPDTAMRFNRISITGNRLTAEFAFPFGLDDRQFETQFGPTNLERYGSQIMGLLGLPTILAQNITVKRQSYAKILPIPEETRKRFILWATENFNIYSFGRYATWRPGLLLDDAVNDLRVIQSIMRHGAYDHRKG